MTSWKATTCGCFAATTSMIAATRTSARNGPNQNLRHCLMNQRNRGYSSSYGRADSQNCSSWVGNHPPQKVCLSSREESSLSIYGDPTTSGGEFLLIGDSLRAGGELLLVDTGIPIGDCTPERCRERCTPADPFARDRITREDSAPRYWSFLVGVESFAQRQLFSPT